MGESCSSFLRALHDNASYFFSCVVPVWTYIMRVTDLLTLAALSGAALAGPDPFQSRCNSFQSEIDIANVTVRSVTYVAAGQNVSQAEVAPACKASVQASVDFCRVTMNISTSDRSHLWAEAWFPRNYTGRFVSTGNGGLAGCKCSLIAGSSMDPRHE